MSNIPVIKILDVKINPLTKAEVLALIKNHLLDPHSTPQQLVTTNPEFIMAAQDDEEFKNIINNSWLSVADGYGIRLAGKYQQAISNFQFPISKIKKLFIGCQIAWLGITRNNKKLDVVPETITGTDLVPEICRLLSVSSDPECHPRESEDPVAISQTCQKIFLLGGFGDVPRLAAERLNSPPYEGGVNSRQKREEEGVNKSQKNILINYSTFEHLSSPPYEGGGEE
ncbi:MAG TPA: hypothetical protein PKZ16_03495, partial [bacterium]|nr:hypothetical protein [bacterium]